MESRSLAPSSEQDKSVVAIRRFFVTRKRQTAAFEWRTVKDTAVKTKPLISKENAQNRPETIQRETVLGVSAFREQIGNSAVKRRWPLCPVFRNTSNYLSKVRGQWSRTGAHQSEDILQFCLDCQAIVYENITIFGDKVSNITCLFALDMILLVCVLKCLKKGDIFAERQQWNKEENTDRVRPSLSGTGV